MARFDAGLIVFDLDGTLIDSARDIGESVNLTFAMIGYDPLPLKTIYQFVGNGVQPLISRSLEAGGHHDRLEETLEKFRGVYQERLLLNTRPFVSVMETLDRLAGNFKLGVATNKPERFTWPILEGLGLSPYFGEAVVAGDTLKVSKPAPDAIFHIARLHDVAPESVVMVGDSAVDVMTGKNAGAATVGVTYGFRAAEEVKEAGADALIDRLDQIIPLLGA